MRAPKKSKTYGLFKSCQHLWDKCDCPWLGRYKQVRYINLGEWAGVHSIGKSRAVEVLADAKKAIRDGNFTTKRVRPKDQRDFGWFIDEYRRARGYGDTHNTTYILNVLKEGLGDRPLSEVEQSAALVEEWMIAQATEREWSNATWNRYRAHAATMFKWGASRKLQYVTRNPFKDLEVKQEEVVKPLRFEDLGLTEEKLLAAVATAYPTTGHPKLDARHARLRSEMTRRIIASLDTGIRREELMMIQVKDVNFNTWEIVLPKSKGQSKTGVQESVYVMSPRLRVILEERRQLGPFAFVFGTEDGRAQKSFVQAWHSVFKAAGITPGREGDAVWHTLRHEFISSVAELTDNVIEVKELARHKNIQTTERYMKAKEGRLRDLLTRKGQQQG